MTIALWAILLVTPVKAQDMCGPYESVVNGLSISQEQVIWRGMIGNDIMVEVWGRSSDQQSWTIVVRSTSGMACIKAMGDGYEFLPTGQGT